MTWQIACFTLKIIADFYGDSAVLQHIILIKTLKGKDCQVDFPIFMLFVPSK